MNRFLVEGQPAAVRELPSNLSYKDQGRNLDEVVVTAVQPKTQSPLYV